MTSPQIIIANSHAQIAACMALRWMVFVEEQRVAPEDELDGTDDGAFHVLAGPPEAPAGAARFHLLDDVVKIGRVCVPAFARGQGIGSALIRFIQAKAAPMGATKARLGAQTHAIAFYEALGFQAVGEEYLDAGIPHRDMERTLP